MPLDVFLLPTRSDVRVPLCSMARCRLQFRLHELFLTSLQPSMLHYEMLKIMSRRVASRRFADGGIIQTFCSRTSVV
jgi:hypothetical protein